MVDLKAIAHTPEFVKLAKFVELMKKKGPTPQIKAFAQKYQAQMQKVSDIFGKMEWNAANTD
jgi:hypothetical protein